MKPKNQEQAVLRLLIDEPFITPLKFVKAGLISYSQRIGERKNFTKNFGRKVNNYYIAARFICADKLRY